MGLEYVKKRDGTTVEFDSEKIRKAVMKAASAVELENEAIGEEITQEVISYLKIFFGDKGIPEVEQIQDLVEKVLIEKGYAEVAKAYILYREQHKKIRDTQKMFNDAIKTMNNYLELEDWKVRENSNMSYSLQGLNNFISSEVTSQYWLQEIYPDKAGEKHLSGDFHIHDLGNLSVYCCGWDLEDFLRTGFRGVPTKIESDPPKHLKTALGQMVNFFFTLQGEAAGAMAFSNFDTLLAPFIAYDNLDYKEVKQAMQEFLFNMNVPTRVGFQTPFTNITMDLTVPNHFKDQPVIIGGEMKDRSYGEFQEEMDLINKAFAEVMMAGDSKGRVFSFPIPTYNITPDFDWDNPVLNPVWEMTAKYGIPYFCLYEKTKIITNNGIKEIGKLEIDNDKVLGEDGKFYSINHYIKNTHSEYIKIITENRKTIKCSKNHKFPTQNGIKKAKNLTIDDQLKEFNKKIIFENGFELSYQNQSFFNIYNKTGENIKFSIIDEKNKDQFYFLKPTNREFKKIKEFTFEKNRFQTTLKEIKIPKSLDEDIFEIIGQLLGDGYLPKNKNNITLVSNDDEIINYFSQTVKSKFDLEVPIYQAGNSETCKEANINSKMFNEYLRHIGLKFGRGNEKEIPSIIYYRTEKEIGSLLRGIFDTDGSISINNGGNPIISLTLKNRKIMQQILELLMFLGITPYYKNKKNKYGFIRIHGSKNINLFKEKINFRIKRKADKLKIKQSNKPNLGDKILTKEQSLQEYGKDHRRYKENDTFRVKKSADGIYLFVEDVIENNNYVSIKSLRRENKKINTVDINVNNESHLFLLENEIISHNSNFVNSDMDPEDARSMCCRLRLDNRELRKRGGGLFGANPMTGSIGVVTLNMPRIGYLAEDKEDYMNRVYELMDIAKESLEIKRKVLENLTEQGLYPYSKFYLRNIKKRFDEYWKNHFNTIGINGMNESLENFMGENITEEKAHQFTIEVMEKMKSRMREYQEETENLYNLEATPAESTSYRLARLDKERFGNDIIAANESRVRENDAEPYYTNSTHLPVGYTDDIFDALEIQDDFQIEFTGGTVFHGFLGERLNGIKSTKKLVKRIAANFKLPYYTITPTFSICPVHGYLPGEHKYCPKCEAEERAKASEQ